MVCGEELPPRQSLVLPGDQLSRPPHCLHDCKRSQWKGDKGFAGLCYLHMKCLRWKCQSFLTSVSSSLFHVELYQYSNCRISHNEAGIPKAIPWIGWLFTRSHSSYPFFLRQWLQGRVLSCKCHKLSQVWELALGPPWLTSKSLAFLKMNAWF